jgi:hypothetical protein
MKGGCGLVVVIVCVLIVVILIAGASGSSVQSYHGGDINPPVAGLEYLLSWIGGK